MKTFYRNSEDEMMAGVCSGLGEYLEFDTTLIRVITIFLGMFFPVAVVVTYILITLLAPKK